MFFKSETVNNLTLTKLALLLMLIAVAACTGGSSFEQSDEGPKLHDDQLAVLARGGRTFGPDCTLLGGGYITINGTDNLYGRKYTGPGLIDFLIGSATTVRPLVRPGKHIVRWTIDDCPPSNSDYQGPLPFTEKRGHYRGSLQFTAEGGHAYRIESEIVGNELWVRLIDNDSKQIVANEMHTDRLDIVRAYGDPVRSRSQLAILSGSYHRNHPVDHPREQLFDISVFVASVDRLWNVPQHWPDQIEIELLPGVHEVEIRPFGERRPNAAVFMTFIAKEGHKYQIRSNGQDVYRGWARTRIWIEDVNAKTVVSELYCKTLSDKSWSYFEEVNCSASPA
jgi:hypothetical protein